MKKGHSGKSYQVKKDQRRKKKREKEMKKLLELSIERIFNDSTIALRRKTK